MMAIENICLCGLLSFSLFFFVFLCLLYLKNLVVQVAAKSSRVNFKSFLMPDAAKALKCLNFMPFCFEVYIEATERYQPATIRYLNGDKIAIQQVNLHTYSWKL